MNRHSLSAEFRSLWRRKAVARRCSLALALLLCAAVAMPVHAATWVVQVGGSSLAFFPQVLTIQAGDTVRFASLGGYHNVFADDGAFRCARGCDNDGQGGNGSPTSQIWTARVTFPDPGQYGYFCEPHGSPGAGMYGTIIVQGPAQPAVPVAIGGWIYGAVLAALLLVTATIRRRGGAPS